MFFAVELLAHGTFSKETLSKLPLSYQVGG